MRIYSVFYEENGKIYNLYENKEGEWWLGGSKLNLHLFNTLKCAQDCVKQIKARNHYPNTYKKKLTGRIFAGRCEVSLTP